MPFAIMLNYVFNSVSANTSSRYAIKSLLVKGTIYSVSLVLFSFSLICYIFFNAFWTTNRSIRARYSILEYSCIALYNKYIYIYVYLIMNFLSLIYAKEFPLKITRKVRVYLRFGYRGQSWERRSKASRWSHRHVRIKGDSSFIRSPETRVDPMQTMRQLLTNPIAYPSSLSALCLSRLRPFPSSWNMLVTPTDFSGNFSGGRARISETVRASAWNHVHKLISLAEERGKSAQLASPPVPLTLKTCWEILTDDDDRGRVFRTKERRQSPKCFELRERETRERIARARALFEVVRQHIPSSRMSLINIILGEFTSSFAISIKPLVKSSAVYNEPCRASRNRIASTCRLVLHDPNLGLNS